MKNNRVLEMAPIIGIFIILSLSIGQCYGALQSGYYNKKCNITTTTTTGFWPFNSKSQTTTTEVNVEATIKDAVKLAFGKDRTLVAALLRMQFHDCFVKGCDASILIEKNKDGSLTEKNAGPNRSVRGYDVIDDIKKDLESKCHQVVSCADIIAIATRDAVNLASEGRVNYVVETGRLDGKESKLTNVNLPPPTISVANSISAFRQKGLDIADMVYLLGGHTVGTAHCSLFQDRVYNFNGSGKPDPTMNSTLVNSLKSKCPSKSSFNNIVPLDQTNEDSSLVVDKSFYNQLVMKRGILKIDQDLANDEKTKDVVKQLAFGNNDLFAQKFGQAMVKLGRVEVITDKSKGEIRTSCRELN
ncbi:peroxidase 60-like [Cannabis sativa]|uniref:peroxidase 60-like n=1 Tax=Cannabis sativa TaxID=3483 RepID=UPI0029CA8E79|nr:peroxidase 60-like [Cannabis sativa]